MDALLNRQRVTMGYIERFWENLVKIGKDKITQPYLRARLELLESYWRKFEENHYNLLAFEQIATAPYTKEDYYTRTEDNYVVFKAMILDHVKDESRIKSGTSSMQALVPKQTQLPKIELPTFSGDELQWEGFRDLFKSLVGDVNDVAPVQKLQYLKSSLTGEAAAAIANIELTEEGYDTAWAELVTRYDNRRILLASHMRAVINATAMVKASSCEIKRLISITVQAKRSFASLDRPVNQWDDWFVNILVEKLDPTTRTLWEASLNTTSDFPTFAHLKEFLQTRARSLEAGGVKTTAVVPCKSQGVKHKVTALTASTGPGRQCALCQGNHYLKFCFRFKKLSATQRRELVKRSGVCFNCLQSKHTATNCTSELRCQRCKGRHHTLLHITGNLALTAGPEIAESSGTIEGLPDQQVMSATNVIANVTVLLTTARSAVLMPTARVLLTNSRGTTFTVRALLDSGSEVSFVSERIAQSLGLARRCVNLPVSGIRAVNAGVIKHEVDVTLRVIDTPEVSFVISNVLVLTKLTAPVPSYTLDRRPWPHLEGLQLADPYFYRPTMVDVILGADVYLDLMREGIKRGPPGTPTAQATAFGLVLMGPISSSVQLSSPPGVVVCQAAITTAELSRILQRFWELDQVNGDRILSPDEKRCEDIFMASHTRDLSGRYTVRLPKREDAVIQLADNRREVLHILISSEARMLRRGSLRTQYSTFMEEYLRLNHMEPASQLESAQNTVCYLQHHAVFKTSNGQNKIRVVFNASYRTATGYALNDLLLPGPKMQSELWLILTRWRLFQFAFTTDIVKMFRQIRVHEDDADLQRILWRSEPTGEVRDFRLKTVTYGTTSAPYLAQRTLYQLAEDETEKYPLGAEAVKQNSYVDDLLTGGHSLDHALEVKRQLIALLAAGGFELSKWAANQPELCPGEDASVKLFHDTEGVETLGVLWNPVTDCFSLRVVPDFPDQPDTKRKVLSELAKCFDPLGWAAPVLVYGKIFMQDLWTASLSWDQPLPDSLQHRWAEYTESLPQLNALSVPRAVNYIIDVGKTEIHGFSDASSRAYAAAVYLRCVNQSNEVTVRLLVAKTRVAPLKTPSVPRLELCGALLLAKLLHATMKGLGLSDAPVYAWTDAEVVLAWLQSHPSRWSPFVANRVAEIQSLLPPENWRYVSSAENPADVATRGITPGQLADSALWWSGPTWLTRLHSDWLDSNFFKTATNEEVRQQRTVLAARVGLENDLLSRYSTMSRLLRITALCLRFLHNVRNPRAGRSGFLSRGELGAARLRWVRIAQQQDFSEEISKLKNCLPLPTRSPLLALRPRLDPQGLLRLGGRLQNAMLPYDEKHPLILSKDNYFSLLWVREAHHASLHGGPQLTRSILLRRIWIVRAQSLIKSVIFKCVRCVRFRGTTATQQLGQLPTDRVHPGRPFRSTGVDYAGPISLRTTKGRGHKSVKGYICVFVCLWSKAIHLEAVSDLTSSAFIAAFRRFTARRGHCDSLLSDNGANFRGADRELRALFKAASSFYVECAASLANDNTNWKFIPPSAPHFGGLWEAGVKAVKFHLRRIIGNHTFTYEELSTLLVQIEACLNSRPLYSLSNDPSDLSALTPGHLLIGEPLVNLPEPPLLEATTGQLVSRWMQVSKMRDHFWDRWSREYVHSLQQLPKWRRATPNLAVGMLVILKDELQPPAKWALARIIEVFPGDDGLVRVVKVKTPTTTLKRPICKICPLPVEQPPKPVAGDSENKLSKGISCVRE